MQMKKVYAHATCSFIDAHAAGESYKRELQKCLVDAGRRVSLGGDLWEIF
jgi:hypothetical protein